MNILWDIRTFLGLVPKESPCITQQDCLWCTPWYGTHIRTRRSLLSAYHTVARFTNKCNFPAPPSAKAKPTDNQKHTSRSLILHFTQTRQYMWKVRTKITNVTQVKCGFHYNDFLENHKFCTALCEDFYNGFLKDQSRYREVSCINTLTPFSEAWLSLVHSSGTSAWSTTLPEEYPYRTLWKTRQTV
jgi:hypothetical protein